LTAVFGGISEYPSGVTEVFCNELVQVSAVRQVSLELAGLTERQVTRAAVVQQG